MVMCMCACVFLIACMGARLYVCVLCVLSCLFFPLFLYCYCSCAEFCACLLVSLFALCVCVCVCVHVCV